MREQVNYLRHLGVLFVTLIIFFLGVFIGNDVENLRVQNLYTQLQEQDLEYQRILAESNYLDYLIESKSLGKNVSCNTIKGSYYTSIENLDDSRLRLENYINTASVNEEEYYRLKSHYENVQINYYITASKISSLCEDELNVILFFYDEEKECPACEDQGIYLDYVKKKLGDDVLIFSLDSQKEGPIQLLAQAHNVYFSELPIIVINGEAFDFSDKDEIFEILCRNDPDLDVCN